MFFRCEWHNVWVNSWFISCKLVISASFFSCYKIWLLTLKSFVETIYFVVRACNFFILLYETVCKIMYKLSLAIRVISLHKKLPLCHTIWHSFLAYICKRTDKLLIQCLSLSMKATELTDSRRRHITLSQHIQKKWKKIKISCIFTGNFRLLAWVNL